MALSTERLAEVYLESRKVIDNKKVTRWLRDLLVESLSPTWREVYEYVETNQKRVIAADVAAYFDWHTNHIGAILDGLSRLGLLDYETSFDYGSRVFVYQIADN